MKLKYKISETAAYQTSTIPIEKQIDPDQNNYYAKIEIVQEYCILLQVIGMHYKISNETNHSRTKKPLHFGIIVIIILEYNFHDYYFSKIYLAVCEMSNW